MSDIHVAPGGGESAPAPATVSTPADTSPITPSQAARALAQRRVEKLKEQQAAPEPVPQAPAVEQQELSVEDNAAQPETVDPGETREADPAELPTIEPPRSWTKDEQEKFKSYPRELQAYLSEREQQRDRAVRQSQNEAAEQRKAIEAERQKAEQVRQQYEAALPELLRTMQEQVAGQFADIRTTADVERLSNDDPFRYLQWTAHRDKVAAVQREAQAAQERQSREWQDKWQEFARSEDAKVVERIPELADPQQRTKVQESAASYLKDTGFSENDLGQLWNGQASLSLRDHRVQGMIRDAVKYREGQEAAKKAIAVKHLPPVQKPGTAAPRGAAESATLKNLSAKLDQSGSIKDAAALLTARRLARR